MFGETTIFYVKNWNHPIEKNSWAEIQTFVPFLGNNKNGFLLPSFENLLGKASCDSCGFAFTTKSLLGDDSGWSCCNSSSHIIMSEFKKTEILYNHPPGRVYFCNHVYDPSVVGWFVCLLLGILSPGKDAT